MTLLDKIREVESLLKKENVMASDLVKAISDVTGSNVYLVNNTGIIMATALPNGLDCEGPITDVPTALKADFKQRIAFTFQTISNLTLESSFLNEGTSYQPNTFLTIIPLHSVRVNSGHLLLTKRNVVFNDEELVVAEVAALISSIFCYDSSFVEMGGETGQSSNIQLVLDSLSYSELKAINNVFNDLNGLEGFLVASKIADRIGISRSVIVNAMRKLESAGIVDSRSLGIKGTYIKVKNPYFLEALKTRV